VAERERLAAEIVDRLRAEMECYVTLRAEDLIPVTRPAAVVVRPYTATCCAQPGVHGRRCSPTATGAVPGVRIRFSHL